VKRTGIEAHHYAVFYPYTENEDIARTLSLKL